MAPLARTELVEVVVEVVGESRGAMALDFQYLLPTFAAERFHDGLGPGHYRLVRLMLQGMRCTSFLRVMGQIR